MTALAVARHRGAEADQLSKTYIVPIAFAVTVLAEAIAGRLTAWTLCLAVMLAVATLALSRWFWTYGLRHYSGASA